MFSDDTKRLVRQRAGGTCECSLDTCPHFGRCRVAGREFHHKVDSEHGGLDTPSNCIYLCKACHARVHTSTTQFGRL